MASPKKSGAMYRNLEQIFLAEKGDKGVLITATRDETKLLKAAHTIGNNIGSNMNKDNAHIAQFFIHSVAHMLAWLEPIEAGDMMATIMETSDALREKIENGTFEDDYE